METSRRRPLLGAWRRWDHKDWSDVRAAAAEVDIHRNHCASPSLHKALEYSFLPTFLPLRFQGSEIPTTYRHNQTVLPQDKKCWPPTMSATTTNSFPWATNDPTQGGSDHDDSGSANSGSGQFNGDQAGASGSGDSAMQLSHGAMIAIIVVVVVVAVGGSTSSPILPIPPPFPS